MARKAWNGHHTGRQQMATPLAQTFHPTPIMALTMPVQRHESTPSRHGVGHSSAAP